MFPWPLIRTRSFPWRRPIRIFPAWRASPKRMDRLWFSKITALNICWSIWTIRPWSTWQMTRRSALWRQEFWRNISPHLYDRRIVSYVIGDRNDNPIVFNTFKAAVKANPDAHPLFHSDYAEFGIIQTGEASIPARFTGKRYRNMTYNKVWTAQVAGATIMSGVRACGQEWKQNCYMIVRIQRKWLRMNLRQSSGDISPVTGITGGSAPLIEVFPQWSKDNNITLPWRKQHRVQNPWGKCVN